MRKEKNGRNNACGILDRFGCCRNVNATKVLAGPCPGLRILATSQRLLRTRFEQVYPVPALSSNDGHSLFVRRVKAADPGFRLDKDDEEKVDAVVAAVDGLPLAIELAAARVRLFGLDRLADEIATTMSSLAGGLSDSPDRHRSLEAAVDWSFNLLDSPDQALLRRASVFFGGFTIEAAESICAGAPVDSVIDSLANLIDSSLVTSRAESRGTRFRILEPVRMFGLTRLTAAGEAETTESSHASYYTALATNAADAMQTPEGYPALQRLAADRHNLNAALAWAADNNPDLGLAAMPVMARCFEMLGSMGEGAQLAQRLLASGGNPEARLSGLLGAGHIAYWRHDFARAVAHYDEAIEISEQLHDVSRLADSHYGKATSLAWIDRYAESRQHAALAQTAYEESGNEFGQRNVIASRASRLWMEGEVHSAVKEMVVALELSQRLGDVGSDISIELAISGILVYFDRLEEGAAVALMGLQRFRDLGDEAGVVHALDWLVYPIVVEAPESGVKLAGAVERYKQTKGGSVDTSKLGIGDPRKTAEEALGRERTQQLWTAGSELSLDEAIAIARQWGEANEIHPASVDIESVLAADQAARG